MALAWLSLGGPPGVARAVGPEDGVVRVRSIGIDGSVSRGSGVVVAPERVATACHVIRRGARIEVMRGTQRWTVTGQVGSAFHDLCVLDVSAPELPPVHSRAAQDLRTGEAVIALGFEGPDDQPVARPGVVAALYAYDGSYVIRTSTAFDFGASGGGLFDAAGNLVGILAFKARTGDNLRFAVPLDWLSPASPVAASFTTITAASSVAAFWERPGDDRPGFLGVALREASSSGR